MNKATTLTFLFVTTERGRYRRQKKKQKKFCTSFLLILLRKGFGGQVEKKLKIKTRLRPSDYVGQAANKFLSRQGRTIPLRKNNSSRLMPNSSGTQTGFSFNLPDGKAGVILLMCKRKVQKNLFEDGVGQFWKNSEQIFNPDKNGTGAIYLRAGIIRKVINANLFIWREARI